MTSCSALCPEFSAEEPGRWRNRHPFASVLHEETAVQELAPHCLLASVPTTFTDRSTIRWGAVHNDENTLLILSGVAPLRNPVRSCRLRYHVKSVVSVLVHRT